MNWEVFFISMIGAALPGVIMLIAYFTIVVIDKIRGIY